MKKRKLHYQPPVHYLVKAGFSRAEALAILKGGRISRLSVEATPTPPESEMTSITHRVIRAEGIADGLRDALRIVVQKGG